VKAETWNILEYVTHLLYRNTPSLQLSAIYKHTYHYK